MKNATYTGSSKTKEQGLQGRSEDFVVGFKLPGKSSFSNLVWLFQEYIQVAGVSFQNILGEWDTYARAVRENF